jgi:hypothetical protein
MDGRSFYDKIITHKHLEWLGAKAGATPDDDKVFICHLKTDHKFAITIPTILQHEWDELEAVLLERRPARVLAYLSRIVGYFSQVHNWNRSKHAELHDRRAGSYALAEQPAASVRAA